MALKPNEYRFEWVAPPKDEASSGTLEATSRELTPGVSVHIARDNRITRLVVTVEVDELDDPTPGRTRPTTDKGPYFK